MQQTVYFSGNVQGIGFRAKVKEIAEQCRMTGNVSNLPNGQVRLEAEGCEIRIMDFLSDILIEFVSNIERLEIIVNTCPAKRREDFKIIGLSTHEKPCLDLIDPGWRARRAKLVADGVTE